MIDPDPLPADLGPADVVPADYDPADEPLRAAFDHLDPHLGVDPGPTYAALRRGPVVKCDHHGGFTVLARHDDVRAVARNAKRFSSRSVSIPDAPERFIPITLDGAEHDSYRSLLAPFFTPRGAVAARDAVDELVASRLNAVTARGACDIGEALTQVVPAITLFRLIGVPADDHARYLRWTTTLLFDETATAVEGASAATELAQALHALVRARRLEGKLLAAGSAGRVEVTDAGAALDLIEALLHARVGGRLLTVEEIVNIAVTLIFGGIGPTTFLLNGALALIAGDAEVHRQLVAEPDLLPVAVEELLRVLSPVQSIGRVVTGPCPFPDRSRSGEGCADGLVEGDRVLLLWASANRDESVFPDADSFVVDRSPNRHLAFGAGVHRCLGAHLARVEIQSVLAAVLTRLTDFEVVDPGGVGRLGGHMAGIHRLTMRWTITS